MIHYSNFILYFFGRNFFIIYLAFILFLENQIIKVTQIFPDDLEKLKDGQLKLAGIIENLVNNQNLGNANILANMEGRLSEVQKQIFESLSGSATKTAKSLGALTGTFSCN